MMKNEKKYSLWSTLIFIGLAAGITAQPGSDITVAMSSPGKKGKLHVDIKMGTVTVKGASRQDVLVRYTSNDGEGLKMTDAGNGMKKISGGFAGLEVLEQDNNVYVATDNWNNRLDVTIEVPRIIDLELKTYNDGNIVVDNIEGEVVLENYNGPISADKISGSLVANTYNGDIKVVFDRLTPDTPLAFSTYNGDVDVTFPATIKASFKLRADNGEIFTGFDMQLSQPEVKQKETSKGWKKTFVDGWITGAVSGGGPEISMKNYHGDIYIRKK